MVAGKRMRLAVRAYKGGLRQRCTAAVRHTLPPRRRREPALAELGHPDVTFWEIFKRVPKVNKLQELINNRIKNINNI